MTSRVGWIDDHELGFEALVLQDESVDETSGVQGGVRQADLDDDGLVLVQQRLPQIYPASWARGSLDVLRTALG